MSYSEPTKFLFLRKKNMLNVKGDKSFSISEIKLQAKKIELESEDSIEREVSEFGPTHVVIESIWVSPEKFAILTHIYPDVSWIVRVRPEDAVLVKSGIGREWLIEYPKYKNVTVKLYG